MWLSRTNDEVGGGVLRAVPFFRAEGPALSMRCRSLVTLASVARTCGHRLSAGPWHEGRFFLHPLPFAGYYPVWTPIHPAPSPFA
jgi:hypothetical protein